MSLEITHYLLISNQWLVQTSSNRFFIPNILKNICNDNMGES